jgi:predicted enzyme related to lactoylglutathione lyase
MSTVKTAIGRFVWHDHRSGDPEKALRFYSELLGWETEMFKAGEMDYPMISVNGTTHGGFGPNQGGGPPHWLGSIGVEDVDETPREAEAAGGSILAAPMDIPEVGRLAVIGDPQGAAFAVYSSASEEWRPSEGVFVWDELHTTDVDGAKAFYGEVVGWSASDRDMGGGVTYTMFESGGEQRAGCMTTMQPDMPPNWLTYIGTDDVDASCKRAEELGAQKMMGPMDIPGVGRSAVLMDPTGAAFALFSPSES